MHIIFSYILLITFLVYRIISTLILFFVPVWLFKKKKDIEGQRILITGAGSGVGRQLAIEFSKHATCLILVDINRSSLLQTEKLLDRRSAVFIYDCDVSDYKKVCEMAENVKKEAGDVDILVNNAGIVSGKNLLELSEEKIVKTMGVNALAHFWMCKAFLPAMIEKNHGHIVSIVSILGKVVSPRLTDYCASKFAALGFAESLEMELREQKVDGVKVTIVCPSHIDTGLFQGVKVNTGPTLTPEYVAKEVVRGVLEEQEIIFIPQFFKHATMVKDLFPRWFIIKSAEFSGDIKCMQKFTGRQENNAHSTDKALKSE